MAEKKSNKLVKTSKKVEVEKPKKVDKAKAKPTRTVKTKADGKSNEIKAKPKKVEAKPKKAEVKPKPGEDKKKKPVEGEPEGKKTPKLEDKPVEGSKDKPTEEKPIPKKEKKEKKPKKVVKIKFHKPRELTPEESQLIKKKPRFFRQELHHRKRLKDTWRTPRGIDSKQHEGKRGKGKVPNIGYKKPKNVSGLSSGFVPVMVYNIGDLDSINPSIDGAIISARIGRKKRNEIINQANTLGITILNPRRFEL